MDKRTKLAKQQIENQTAALTPAQVVNDIYVALRKSKTNDKSGADLAYDIITDSVALGYILEMAQPAKGNNKDEILCCYALHALLLLLHRKHPYGILDKININTLKSIFKVAKERPCPDLKTCSALLDKRRVKKDFKTNKEILLNDAIKTSLLISIAVIDDWEMIQKQIIKWENDIIQHDNAIVTSTNIKLSRILAEVPVDQSKIGETWSWDELASHLGIDVEQVNDQKHKIARRMTPKDRAEFESWFEKQHTRGNPLRFKAERFEQFKKLSDGLRTVKGSKWSRNDRNTKPKNVDNQQKLTGNEKVEYINPQPIVTGGEKVEFIDKKVVKHKTRAKRHLGVLDITKMNTVLNWVTQQCEMSLQKLVENENAYETAKKEADATNNPKIRAELLSEQISANQAVLESQEAFDNWDAEATEGKQLVQERTTKYESFCKAQAEVKQIDAKIMQFINKHHEYSI